MCHRLGGVERLAAADADHNTGPVLRRGARDPLDLAGEHSPPKSTTSASRTSANAGPTTSRTAGSSKMSGLETLSRSSSDRSVPAAPRPGHTARGGENGKLRRTT
jgi:hypothetical protein